MMARRSANRLHAILPAIVLAVLLAGIPTSPTLAASAVNPRGQAQIVAPRMPVMLSAVEGANSPGSPSSAGLLIGATCVTSSDCWAVGSTWSTPLATLIEQNTGNGWTIVSSPSVGSSGSVLQSIVCVTASNCWAVGYYTSDSTGYYQTRIEQNTGSGWTVVSSPDPGVGHNVLSSVSCNGASSCWAVGWKSDPGVAGETLTEQYDGSAWAVVSSPNVNNTDRLYGVACLTSSNCWAVGMYNRAGGGLSTLAEQFNGSTWSVVSTPNALPSGNNRLYGISCASATDCQAVGYIDNANEQLTLAEHYTASGWAVEASPSIGSSSNVSQSVVCAAVSSCWAVGSFTPSGNSPPQTLIEQFTTTGWQVVTAVDPTGGAPLALENTSGGNPSEPKLCAAQGSAGDPCNTASGTFSEAYSDLIVPGRGLALDFTRSYSSSLASVNGPLGYGWTDSYGLSLSVDPQTLNVTAHQENGAQSTFVPSSGGQYTAAPRVIATLVKNSDGTYTYTRGQRTTYKFNVGGQLTSETDLNGNSTNVTYPNSTTTVVTDPAGRTLTLTYQGGHLTSVADQMSRTATYTYDTSGNLYTVTDVNQGLTKFTYDANHLLKTITDPRGSVTQNTYDAANRVSQQLDGLNRKTTFVYTGDFTSPSGGTTTITDPMSNVTFEQYYYSLRSSVTRGFGTSSATTTSYTYDPTTLRITAIVDPNGQTTSMTYDSSGNLLSATDALGHVTSETYDSLNDTLTVTDPNQVQTTNTYGTRGNLSTTSTPLIPSSPAVNQLITYNHANGAHPEDVTSMVDPDGKTWQYGYDATGYGYRTSTTDPIGNQSTATFNSLGWKVTAVSPSGNVTGCNCASQYTTTYSYVVPGTGTTDEWGDVQTATDPLGHATTYGYDADRNVVSVTDADGHITTYTFDLANEKTQVKRADNSTVVTDYNADGTILDQKDGKGNAVQAYGYNSLAQRTSVKDAVGDQTIYAYDGDGNLLTTQSPGGNCSTGLKCATNVYDAAGEMTSVTYSDGITPNVTAIHYDADGQKISWTDGTANWIQVFDSLNRMPSVTEGGNGTIGYTYNLRNLPLTVTYPGGTHSATDTYDSAGRWTKVQDWNGATTTFAYDPNSNLTTYTLPAASSVVDKLAYNKGDYLTSITDKKGSTTFLSATYGHDSAGWLTSDSSAPTNQTAYKYTPLEQVCYAGSANSSACSSPPSGANSVAYDPADNLAKLNSTSRTQQFNNADEQCWSVTGTSTNACASPPSGATVYSYDASGNRTASVPTSGPATCDTYDLANRLVSIKTGTGSSCTSPTTVGSYSYDGAGLRMRKTAAGVTTTDTWNLAGALPLLLEEKTSSSTTDYVYGPGGQVLEQIHGTTTLWYHHDDIGSTRALTDATGTVQQTYQFDPYGSTVGTTGSVTNPFEFTGEYRDGESGLYYLRARYYDPSTSQFLTMDPAVAKTMSPYGYAGGSPLSHCDPTGLDYDYYRSYDLGTGGSPASVLWWLTNHAGYEFPFSIKNLSFPYTVHGPGFIGPLGSSSSTICQGGNYSLGSAGAENPVHVDEAGMEGNVAVLKFTALPGHIEGEGSTIRFSSWVDSRGHVMFDVTGHDTFNYDSGPVGGLYDLTFGWVTHGIDQAWAVGSTWDTLASRLRG